MTKHEWLNYARLNEAALVSLINSYHPKRNNIQSTVNNLPITAERAEEACRAIRDKIAKETSGDPARRFTDMVREGNIREAVGVLNAAWFGVPESIGCWNIEGFREAVELIEEEIEDDDFNLHADCGCCGRESTWVNFMGKCRECVRLGK